MKFTGFGTTQTELIPALWMFRLRKPVLCCLVNSKVTCFLGALRHMPMRGYNQLHTLEGLGREKTLSELRKEKFWISPHNKTCVCINYFNTMAQGERSCGRSQHHHIPKHPVLATASKATHEAFFIGRQSTTLPVLHGFRPTAPQPLHTSLRFSSCEASGEPPSTP